MVFFVLTRKGYDELFAQFGRTPSPLWIAAGVLSDEELEALREANVSNFSFSLSPTDSAGIDDAIRTIAQHHPGHKIWVEREGDV